MVPDPLEAAKAAQEHARKGFLDAVDMGAEVRRLTARLNDHARKNHFGEGLEQAMMRRRSG